MTATFTWPAEQIEIQLPVVAEMVNARLEPDTVATLERSSQGQKVLMTGVWRIWFEHLGKEDQIQGNPVDVPATSNPAHLFEIHPITNFAGNDLLTSFTDIKGYTAYPAHVAFPFYEKVAATIQASDGAISIASGEGKYNYAEFVMELAGTAACTDSGGTKVSCDDGEAKSLFVLADVFELREDGEDPVTADARQDGIRSRHRSCNPSCRTHESRQVTRIGHPAREPVGSDADVAGTEATRTHLPYEMIIVAVLP